MIDLSSVWVVPNWPTAVVISVLIVMIGVVTCKLLDYFR